MGISPGTYTQNIDVGRVTALTVSGLTDGQTYYIAVTAYDIFGNESIFSNEVSTTLPEATAASGEDSSESSIQGGDTTEDPTLTSGGSSSDDEISSGDTACGRGKSCDHSKRSKSKDW